LGADDRERCGISDTLVATRIPVRSAGQNTIRKITLIHYWLTALGGLLVSAAEVRAGMPSPLPTDDDLVKVFHLTETAGQRLQVISFFLLGLLLCAAAVKLLWNSVRRDVPRLPRLTFVRALAGVILWGLLFVIVLTMIAGARELMTPGAWKKQGWTYKLADGNPADPDPATLRRRQLERLGTALLHFAATHQGSFPDDRERVTIPADLWNVPESAGLRFVYVPGRSAAKPEALVAYEPEPGAGGRLILRADGSVATVSEEEFERLRLAGGRT